MSRCDGAMVFERFQDMLTLFYSWRCVNCGEILDPVVSKNGSLRAGRRRRQWANDSASRRFSFGFHPIDSGVLVCYPAVSFLSDMGWSGCQGILYSHSASVCGRSRESGSAHCRDGRRLRSRGPVRPSDQGIYDIVTTYRNCTSADLARAGVEQNLALYHLDAKFEVYPPRSSASGRWTTGSGRW